MLGECNQAIDAASLGDHAYFAYVDTDDAAALFGELGAKGVEFVKPLADEPWGRREFGIRTVGGHRMMFGRDIQARSGVEASGAAPR